MTRPIQYTNHAYEVVGYSPTWPDWYTVEAEVLKQIFEDIALKIDHVGSTSIPGMAAKPQLDILVQVEKIEYADNYTDALRKVGYEPYGDMLHKGGRLFSKWKGKVKVVNLHVYETSSPIVWEYLSVRDYLRTHPQEAEAYASLKIELYKKYPDDYLKYREFKDPYIDALKERIRSSSEASPSVAMKLRSSSTRES